MKRPRTISVLAPLALVLLGATSCDNLSAWRERINEETVRQVNNDSDRQVGTQTLNTIGNSQILTNDEAGIQITLPDSWIDTSRLHGSAELQAANLDRQLYLVVVAENTEELTRLGLKENAAKYRDLLIADMESLNSEFSTDVAFVGTDDYFADQYEIRGQAGDGTPVVYLHTTVLVEGTYYQVVAWTTPDQYQFYRSELRTIVDTFRETESS